MTLTLTQALDIFSDNLHEIKQSCIENMQHIVQGNYPVTTADFASYLIHCDSVGEIVPHKKWLIQRFTGNYHRTIKRIVSKMTPPRAGNITADDIARAKEFPIEELIDTQLFGHEDGRRFTHCPFHQERSASFCIHKDNRWSCFGTCGEHGDVIDFYIKQNNLDPKKDFPKAVKELIKR